MTEVSVPGEPAQALNSCQYTAKTKRGDYLVQVSWPLTWSRERTAPEGEDVSAISTM